MRMFCVAVVGACMASAGFAAGPQLRSGHTEGWQPLFALAANLCVGAMRMGNALPLRVLDNLGESPQFGMANRLFSDPDRMIEVVLAGTSPGEPVGEPVLCLAQPRQAMPAADKAELRNWVDTEFARMAEADGVALFDHDGGGLFTRIIYWCDGQDARVVMAFSQATDAAELRLGVTHSLPGGAEPECPGGRE